MIPRHHHLTRIRDLLKRHPVVALIGARQVGKTTLAHMLAEAEPQRSTYRALRHFTPGAPARRVGARSA